MMTRTRIARSMAVVVAAVCAVAAFAGEANRADIQRRLEHMASSRDPRIARPAVSLLTQLDYYDYTHTGGGYAYWGEPTLDDIAGDAVRLGRREDPFAAKRGNFIKGYRAANDLSRQPYSISVPAGYTGQQPMPLLVDLHCHGWSQWYRPFQGHPAMELDDMIVVAPHGRGSCDYMWIAEDDVLAVIEEAERDYRIDPDRVYVTGYSMGGTGSWNMAVRFPGRFAASYPVAGNADISAWIKAWNKKEDRETPLWDLRWFMRTNTSPVTFAENLCQMPVRVAHGALDSVVPVGHARSITQRLRELGYENIEYEEDAGGTHFLGAPTSERIAWLRRFRRDPWPRHVRYKTAWYRYPGAYWVRINRFAERLKFAEIDVSAKPGNRVEVKTSNITEFMLTLNGKLVDMGQPVAAVVNGAAVRVQKVPPHGVVVFVSDGKGGWQIEGRQKPDRTFPPGKHTGQEGPIEDCVRERFLVVYGTQGDDAWRKEIIRREALRWCRQWLRRFVAMPPYKPDSDVTAADIRECNLILFGGPECNAITKRVLGAASFPVRPEAGRIVAGKRTYAGEGIGVKLCYPNPLQPDRMVVICAANTWKGMWQMSHRFGNWFDWVPYDNRDWFDYAVFDDKTTGPETFIESGFFNDQWQQDRRTGFPGVEKYRGKAVARVYPKHLTMPDERTVCLSDVMPTQADTAKGPLVFDRSWECRPLSIGERPFEKGFGQKVMSSIEYRLGGKFSTFEVTVGVDLEGLTGDDLSDERKQAEFVLFQVYGDGRLLATKGSMGWDTPAERIQADVTGVQVLRLVADKETPEGWHYGSIAWGNPLLKK